MTDGPAGQPGSHKSEDAYRTIGEVAAELDLPQHVLRFWETRFPQVKPLKRAGGRRFYRPGDVALLRAVRVLLYDEGYTIKGVQRLLTEHGARHVADALARSRAARSPAASGSEPAFEPPAAASAAPPAAPSGVAPVLPSEAARFRDGGDETSASMAERGRLAGPAALVPPLGAGAAGEPRRSSPSVPTSGPPAHDADVLVLVDRLSLVLAELAECARLLAGVRSTRGG